MIKTAIIAVDFDGTLCNDEYPDIGAPKLQVISLVKKLKAAGNVLILYTCRRDAYLTAAVDWCAARGIIFDYINENAPRVIEQYGTDTRKISADIYIDDKAINLNQTLSTFTTIAKHIAAVVAPADILFSLMDKPDKGGGENVKI